MTIMRVSVAGIKLTPAIKSTLAKRLIKEFAKVEVGNFSEIVASGFMAQIEEVDADSLWLGLNPAVNTHPSAIAVIITAQVMAGPWNEGMKKELFVKLDAAVREVLEIPDCGNNSNVWMTITEIPKESFGVGGEVVSIAQLSSFFSEDRQERINDYLNQ